MTKINIALAVLALSLAGCQALPTAQDAANADFGPYPDNYKEITQAYYASILKDPESAKYQSIEMPHQATFGSIFEGSRYGYLVCATLNAKNSYGGYIGNQTDGLLIRDGVVIKYISKGNWGNRQVC
jgi:hypothetical protein